MPSTAHFILVVLASSCLVLASASASGSTLKLIETIQKVSDVASNDRR